MKNTRPPKGSELLRRFRGKRNQVQTAAALQLDQGQYSYYENGKKTPGLATALRIERLTSGAVPASSWVPEEAAIAKAS